MDVTEVVQYLVGPTERQGKDIPSLNSGISATESGEAATSWRQGPGHDGAQWRGQQMVRQQSQAMEASRKLSAAVGITEKVIWTTQPLKETDLPEARKSPGSRV